MKEQLFLPKEHLFLRKKETYLRKKELFLRKKELFLSKKGLNLPEKRVRPSNLKARTQDEGPGSQAQTPEKKLVEFKVITSAHRSYPSSCQRFIILKFEDQFSVSLHHRYVYSIVS